MADNKGRGNVRGWVRPKGNGPDGKFDSIGSAGSQRDNLALVTRLLPGVEQHAAGMTEPERGFVADCRLKLTQYGGQAMFGWRQVSKMVELAGRFNTTVRIGMVPDDGDK